MRYAATTYTYMHAYIQPSMRADRQADRDGRRRKTTNRPTDGQTDRQTDHDRSVFVSVRNICVCMYKTDGIMHLFKFLSVHISKPAPLPRTVSASRSMSSSRQDVPKQGFTIWEVGSRAFDLEN